MKKLISLEVITFSLLLWLMLFSLRAHAAIDNTNVLDDILARYLGAASAWAAIITERASWLFCLLVTISVVWTFGVMALRRADIEIIEDDWEKETYFADIVPDTYQDNAASLVCSFTLSKQR